MFSEDVAAEYGTVVVDPLQADLAIVRIHAPYEKRSTAFENYFHAGSLEMDDETVSHLTDLSRKTTTIVDVFLDRPAILSPVLVAAHAVVANYGAHPRAVLDVLFGRDAPRGRLPFDLPSSMAAVEASRPDVPFDTADPRLRFGHGLSYDSR
ncbi:glycoside hydrolase family 3 C-terminal domain-containing protein [Microbacterium sp. LWO13-1.2]|uniref:glycoside hydrolase family 3 C-terminal domain-containing protein n=1 Tax=Microbacterium sp. LWO13-1.2 TaxID=3135262 RepID=UPI003138C9B3